MPPAIPSIPHSEAPIQALGIDLVYLPRLRATWARYGQRLFQKVLTADEIAFCVASSSKEIQFSRFASRIAVKEATMKALGTGLSTFGHTAGINWKQIEMRRAEGEAPSLVLYGKAQNIAAQKHIATWLVSTSHDGDYATAIILGA